MSNQISRRDFVRKMAMGSLSATVLLSTLGGQLEAAGKDQRHPLVWLSGHSANLHRNSHWAEPEMARFLANHFRQISTDSNKPNDLPRRLNDGKKPFLIVDGYFPAEEKDWTFMQLRYLIKNAAVVILIGNEAAYSQTAPDGFLNLEQAFLRRGKTPVIRLPGQTVQATYLLGVLNYLMLYNKMPDLDELRRPLMFYGETVCSRCEFRSDFEAGNFVSYFGEKKGCLYKLGCKGPITRNTCPQQKFNDTGTWCVAAGSPCVGCSEPDFPGHSGIGMYGALSGNVAGVNSALIRNSGTIAQGAVAVTGIGIGLHAISKRNYDPKHKSASFNDIEEDHV